MSRRRPRAERGAAVADFVLVSGLVTLLFVGVLQLGFALFVRNTLISGAGEGARVAAREGAAPQDGVARTRELITASLSERFAEDISVSRGSAAGAEVVVVTVTAPVPVLGPFGVGSRMTVTGRAHAEGQP